MTKTLEENQAFVKALVEAINERGRDYIYEYDACRYIINDCPACLIGVALVKSGHTHTEILNDEDCYAISGPNGESGYDKMKRFGYAEEICMAARRAQNVQDERGTWGEAEKVFFEYLKETQVMEKYASGLSKVD